MRITKKRLALTEELLKIKHQENMNAIHARVENLARGKTFWEKVKLVFKI